MAPAQTSPQIMSQFPHQKKNQKPIKKSEAPFSCVQFVSPSVWFVFSMPNSPTPAIARRPSSTWRAVTRLPESRVGPPTPLEWKFCLETPRFTRAHGAESMAKTVMQNMDVSFMLGKRLTNVEMFHVQNVGYKWKCLGFWKEETKLVTRTSHMSQCSSLCVHLS